MLLILLDMCEPISLICLPVYDFFLCRNAKDMVRSSKAYLLWVTLLGELSDLEDFAIWSPLRV